jgi:Protein of unknown function (DUF4238)
MALDHYVPQVHLKNFYSKSVEGKFFGVKKADLKLFQCSSKDVCRMQEFNTNPFMDEQRVIEEFLKSVEPNYNSSVWKLLSNEIDHDVIFVIAAYAAFIMCFSPAGARISSKVFETGVKAFIEIAEKQGKIGPPPSILGNSISDAIQHGIMKIDIDQNYPKAIGTTQIFTFVNAFANSHWEILEVRDGDGAFFTSDFPVAIEKHASSQTDSRIFPLLPNLAVRIAPHLRSTEDRDLMDFSGFTFSRKKLNISEIERVNRKLVQCAEEVVFYPDNTKWLLQFVNKWRGYRVETVEEKVLTEHGHAYLHGHNIVAVVHKNMT